MPIRAVLFDRDGVLVDVHWRGIHEALISKLPIAPTELDERWHQWVVARGAGSEDGDPRFVDTFLQSIAEETNDPVAQEALRRFRLSDFVRAYPEVRGALECARKASLRIGVLSNNTILLGSRELLTQLGLDELVDVALTAQGLGVSKPEPMAYLLAAQALGVQLDECLFFDDRAEWATAARMLGIHAFHVDRLRTDDCVTDGIVHSLDKLDSLLRERCS